MTLPHLNALRALESAVRHGSFRGAGDELCVSPAAVGQQVRRLEEFIGCELLIRKPNGFEATDLAVRATKPLANGFEHIRDALEILQDRKATQRLAITLVPTIAEYWLAPRLPEFMGQHPGMDLRIDSTHTQHFKPSADFDFALRYEATIPGTVEEIALFDEWLVPVCIPELAKRLRIKDRADPFRDVPLLHVERESDDPLWLGWGEWGKRFKFKVPPARRRMKFKHTTLALRSAFAGHGVHLAQLSIAVSALGSGSLVAPFGPKNCAKTGYPYRLSSFSNARRPELHLAFADWVREQGAGTNVQMQEFLSQ